MTCLECRHIKTHRGNEAMARMGFVGCAKKPVWYTRSIKSEADCKTFERAEDAQVLKAQEWAGRLKP